MTIKVLIADDDPFTRDGLEIILGKDPDFTIVASVENGKKAVQVCLEQEVDIALLDIKMPVLSGVEAVKEIVTERPRTKCVILTTFEEDELVQDAVKYGAKAYLLKGKSAPEIKNILKVIQSGSSVFQDSVFSTIQSGNDRPQGDMSSLSGRETEVMRLIAEGLSNKDIGKKLFLSEGTIKNYVSSILSKLGLKQRTQIAVYYLRGKS